MSANCERILCLEDKCVQKFKLVRAYIWQLPHSNGMDKYTAK